MSHKRVVIEVSRGLMSIPRIDERVTEALVHALADNQTVIDAAAAAVDATGVAQAANRADTRVFDVRKYGAVCDGVTDDTAAWQLMLDTIAVTNQHGAEITGTGTSRVTGTLHVKSRNINVVGNGHRNLQSYPLPNLGADAQFTIFNDHDGPLFKLSHGYRLQGFALRDLTLVGNGNTAVGADNCALDFDLAGPGSSIRDFNVDRVSITRFNTAFLTQRTSPETGTSAGQVIGLNVTGSNIMHNRYIAQCLDGTSWNGFTYERNDSGQNGYGSGGGLHVIGHNLRINYNILEGQRDPIRISGHSGRTVVIKGNYFEANVGDACIWVDSVVGGVDIGPNFFGNVSTTHRVYLGMGVGGGICTDPYFPEGAMKMMPPPNATSPHDDENALEETELDHGREFVYVDAPSDAMLAVPRGASAIAFGGQTLAHDAAPSPFTPPGVGQNFPVTLSTLPSTGLTAFNFANYPITAGEVVVANFLFRRLDDPANAPVRIQLRPDDSIANGVTLLVHSPSRRFRNEEWVSVTVAFRATVNSTSLMTYLFAYGDTPGAATGKLVQFRRPTLYKVQSLRDIRPYHKEAFTVYNAAPTTGTWARGDEVFRYQATVGQPYKWVCTASGTPGTWAAVIL